jgi:hypothetical protein
MLIITNQGYVGGRADNYRQTSIGRGFKNQPYMRNRDTLGKDVMCHSSINRHS